MPFILVVCAQESVSEITKEFENHPNLGCAPLFCHDAHSACVQLQNRKELSAILCAEMIPSAVGEQPTPQGQVVVRSSAATTVIPYFDFEDTAERFKEGLNEVEEFLFNKACRERSNFRTNSAYYAQ